MSREIEVVDDGLVALVVSIGPYGRRWERDLLIEKAVNEELEAQELLDTFEFVGYMENNIVELKLETGKEIEIGLVREREH